MGSERSSIFGDDDFDLTTIKPKKIDRPSPEVSRDAAETAGFKSREPKVVPMAPPAVVKATPQAREVAPAAGHATLPRQQRRHRTGRNAQLNLKAKAETIAEFTAIADAQGWVFGEALEHAVVLLREKYVKAPQ